jgi:hypothetical protein
VHVESKATLHVQLPFPKHHWGQALTVTTHSTFPVKTQDGDSLMPVCIAADTAGLLTTQRKLIGRLSGSLGSLTQAAQPHTSLQPAQLHQRTILLMQS